MLNPEEYCDMLDYVETPSLSNIGTVMYNNVNSTTRCLAQCTWVPEDTNGTLLVSDELFSSEEDW